VNSEILAKMYVTEIKRVISFSSAKLRKKGGQENAADPGDVIENKWRENATFSSSRDVDENTQVKTVLWRCC
jgi:hypothetical protein